MVDKKAGPKVALRAVMSVHQMVGNWAAQMAAKKDFWLAVHWVDYLVEPMAGWRAVTTVDEMVEC